MPGQLDRRLPALAVIGMLLAGGLQGCAKANAEGPAAEPPSVTVAAPLVKVESDWSDLSGRFAAAEAVEVRPRVSGYLRAVHFRDGQFVQKGQLLFSIDPLPFEARAARAQAEVAQTDARLERARSELKRAETLRAADAISAEEFESRREAQAQAVAARAAAQAALKSEALDLSYTRVVAPISGRISDRRVDAGNLVTNGESVLTRIVSVDPIHFEFAAPDAALPPGAAVEGARAMLKLEGDTEFKHPGRLDFVDNAIDARTGSIRGRVLVANTDGAFTPGQFGRVRLFHGAPKPTMFAPASAIGSDQSRKFVLVVNASNTVEYRRVELGPEANGLRIVKTGLAPSDRIVIRGLQLARPGQKVRPVTGRIESALAASADPAATPQG